MIRPAAFGYNNQTAVNNAFQNSYPLLDLERKVIEEFDAMVSMLRSHNIDVMVIDDTKEPQKPDAIFPNNWFCTLADGTICIFPMFAENRRVERRKDILEQLMHEFIVHELEDWTDHEKHNIFLEGTGSMVFDHEYKKVYACISDRAHPLLLHQFTEKIGYDLVSFNAKDKNSKPIYHTNVLMCIGNAFAVVCIDVIDEVDKMAVNQSLQSSNKDVIEISYEQLTQFAGNMLQLQKSNGEFVLVMSHSAFDSLSIQQKEKLGAFTKLLPVSIPTIETVGGGSARCMMADIFLQRRS